MLARLSSIITLSAVRSIEGSFRIGFNETALFNDAICHDLYFSSALYLPSLCAIQCISLVQFNDYVSNSGGNYKAIDTNLRPLSQSWKDRRVQMCRSWPVVFPNPRCIAKIHLTGTLLVGLACLGTIPRFYELVAGHNQDAAMWPGTVVHRVSNGNLLSLRVASPGSLKLKSSSSRRRRWSHAKLCK